MLALSLVGAAGFGGAATARADEAGCAAVDVVVARGTTEPGHFGAAVGDPLVELLSARLPGPMSAYRVNYPADLTFSIGLGSADLVAHLTQQAQACPGQRFVLVGYSQGAVVVHAALGTGAAMWIPGVVVMPDWLGDRVDAILLFGDPARLLGAAVPERYLTRTGSWCIDGDPVCQPGGNTPAAHVAYGAALVEAADFTAGQV
ncbi:cutinase family protein [Nocardia sp. IFM 10818]